MAVTDTAGREIMGRFRFLATYGTFRVHVEPLSYSVQKGQTASFAITAIDYDNKPIQTRQFTFILSSTSTTRLRARLTSFQWAIRTSQRAPTAKLSRNMPVNAAGSLNLIISANTSEASQRCRTPPTYGCMGNGSDSESYGDEFAAGAGHCRQEEVTRLADTAHLTLISQVAGFHALVTATGYTAEFRKVLSTEAQNAQLRPSNYARLATEPHRRSHFHQR